MVNLSRRAKFLSIVAALGNICGVANAGKNNENRNNIKHKICKSSSIAKERKCKVDVLNKHID